jgi:predicted negative regulator of RcsB-dependent stress response
VRQHISRKELKKDKIRETLQHGTEVLVSHLPAVLIIGGVALLVFFAPIYLPKPLIFWARFSERLTLKASAALADGMKIFQARIRPVGEAEQPGEISYVDEKNKYADAEKMFLQVANQYGRTRPGQIARYYAALSEVKLKKFPDAERNLKSLDSSGDETLTSLARFQLAGVYDQEGKATQAVDVYKQLIDKPTIFVPKPLVLLTLADHYRKSDPAQATKLYTQIKQDFPDTAAADQADQDLQMLNSKT